MSIKRKLQLQRQIRKLHEELSEIEGAEATKANQRLIGKCYRYRNSFGSSDPKGDWWLYEKVIRADGNEITTFGFQKDSRGHFEIAPEGCHLSAIIDSYEEISPDDFNNAWEAFSNELEKVQPMTLPKPQTEKAEKADG
jgi:hypothetical protein